MTRLIDKDAIPWQMNGVGDIPVVTREEIEAMPTYDSAPIIRCGQCGRKMPVESDGRIMCLCMWLRRFVKADEYCAWAEMDEQ